MKITKTKLKQIIEEEVRKLWEAKKSKPPEFKSGQRVEHEEYGKGTVTHSGACPASGESRKVSVKWDDPNRKAQCIELNLKKI